MKIKAAARQINGHASVLLDSLRIFAALVVFYIHAFDKWFPNRAHPPSAPGEPSHAAVVVFFVLSGFVIAHTTISNNRGGRQYAQARLSRLCSIVLPVLLITALIEFTIGIKAPEMLDEYTRGHAWVRYLASGLFVNELWFFSAAPPINISLWSLSFEFWYYAIFGCWFFRSSGWKGYLLPLAALLIAGPKIMLMMPVWLAGYLAYTLPRPVIKPAFAWMLIALGLGAGWLAVVYMPSIPYRVGYQPLYYANQFFTDWVIGFFIAFALWLLPSGTNSSANLPFSAWLRKAADLTFPLYVLHFPLLVLWRCIFGYHPYHTAELWEAMLTVLLVAGGLGIFLEAQRPFWSGLFKRMLGSSNDGKSNLEK